MGGEVSILRTGDEAELMAFCERTLESSLFLVSNAERAGLEYEGLPLQGTYAVHRVGGNITAVAAHCWNGVIVVQGDVGLEQAAWHAVASSGRPVQGLIGPLALVKRARVSLGLDGRDVAHGGDETLFALDLERLQVPAALGAGKLSCRHPTEDELPLLAAWRVAYCLETLGSTPGAELEKQCREQLEALHRSKECWVLMDEHGVCAFTAFNGAARGIVQVGGVYTPPKQRSRGYARAAVAGSLLEARSNGAKRSVLFTRVDNPSAIRAYTALGYEAIGEFGLLLFR